MILTDPTLWRLVWKEYRTQRTFWLAIAGAAVGFMFLLMWLLDVRSGREEAPWGVALILPLLFALGSSAVSFASETEEGTTDLLRIMAARTSRVFWSKVAFSLAGTLAMIIFLLAVARLVTWGDVDPTVASRSVMDRWPIGLAFTMQLLAWGFFFSLVCRKVLTAVCLTSVVSPASVLSAFALISGGPPSVPNDYAFLLFVPPVLAISYLLTARMMSGGSWDFSLPLPYWSRSSAIAALEQLAAVRETAPLWRRLFTRLVWLELRAALSLGHVLWIAGLLGLVFYPFGPFSNIPGPDPARTLFGVVFSSLLAGVWTFQAEGGKRTRFLADHGLSPQVVWLSKQFVWGLLAIAVAAPFLWGVSIANHTIIQHFQGRISSVYQHDVPGASAVAFVATLGCLAYAVGQFASMLIPRAITAGFIACVFGTLLSLWTWLMLQMRVPLALSAAPVFVILLATTLGWSRRWLLEQATGRSWLRLILVLTASAAAVWGAIGVFRVFEVPRPDFVHDIAPLRESQGRPITTDEAATAGLYRQAVAQIKWGAMARSVSAEDELRTARAGWASATDLQRQWLEENRDALKLCLAAAERPTCAFNDPARPIAELDESTASQTELTRLATLILLSARELEAAGKLDEALQRYVATLRLARHAADRGTATEWSAGVQIERMVSAWIPMWAAHPDQTAERIEAGVLRIKQEVAQYPSLRDAVLMQQFMIRRALRDDWSQVLSRRDPTDDVQIRMGVKVVDVCGPWERARALRVLDLFDASQLHCVDVLNNALNALGTDVQDWADAAAALPSTQNPWQPVLNRQVRIPQGSPTGPNAFFNADASAINPRERIPWNWLNSTPLLMEVLPPDHSRIWQMGLQRELGVRIMGLRLKLAAFKKANDEYPDQLNLLFFGMDAIDPYSGAEFGYRPHGYQTSVRVVNGLTDTVELVEARTPIIWCAGSGNVRIFGPLPPDQELPDRFAHQNLTILPLAFTLPR